MEGPFVLSAGRFSELDILPVIVVETDIQGTVTFVNENGFKMLGYLKEELLGQPFFKFIAPEDVSRCVTTARNVMAGKRFYDNEFTVITKDGTRIQTFIQSAPMHNDQGELKGLRGVVVQIGRDKSIEAVIRAREEKYRTLVNNIKLGVARSTVGKNARLLEINKAMEDLTGYSREELLSMNSGDLFSTPDIMEEVYKEIIQSGSTIHREFKLKKKDGSEILLSKYYHPG